MTSKQEMLALGVRGARKRRDLMTRRAKLKNYEDPTKSEYFHQVSNQDNLVQKHLQQFQHSLKRKTVNGVTYTDI